MARFVVFLRAINVGGHPVVKAKLKEAFICLGYQKVSTHKQSGNIILETDEEPTEIRRKVQKQLQELLGNNVAA
ncbi:MAG TPA: DUF1697 domain-containing protein, partial [Verrucomicrobiae bacterium]|nr:DUF1697 domain-containing protein [Verrucomicrobiae bacterium]